MMTETEFRALAAQGYNRIPLVLESFADLDTPLSLYLKLAHAALHVPARVGGRRRALRPLLVHRAAGEGAHSRRGRHVEVEDRGGVVERHDGDPLAFIAPVPAAAFAPRRSPGLPRFCGGLAGYFGYDTVRHIETQARARRQPPADALGDLPDMLLLLTEELAVVDNLAGKIYLIVYADPGEPNAYCERARPAAAAAPEAARRR